MAPEDESVLKLDPARLWELQQEYTRSIANLWTEMLEGKDHVPPSDKRFGSTAWQGLHAYLAEVYVLNARFMTKLAESIEAGPKMRAKVRFAINQWVDAMSPANFLATNPEAQQKILATQGQSLSASLGNLMADLQKGRISQTDESAFQIGRNVATTPGAVIFQNEIFQLLQYAPTTETVFERPLLIVPPCINKYYILDLQPENSFVAHAVAQGHTVYVISWRNPTPSQAALSWDDYIAEGVIRAIHLAQELSKQKQINVLGFCIGGTLTATALSVLRARGEDAVASVTLLTTLLDFSDTGVLGVFVDEQQVRMREQSLGGQTRKGVKAISPHLMPGRELAASFSFLRPNELVWNYVVNNYLKGEAPPPFDLLYWNADSTNLPGPFFVWYLRNTYLEDKLKVPGALKVCGKPVDLGAIRVPAYVYASREDHIVPWNTAFASTRLLKGPTRFVLGASGHIAGVINPPEKNKRNYWAVPADGGPARVPEDPDEWFSLAKEIAGSWWPDWYAWLAPFGGRRIPAPKKPGDAHHKPLEKAPGSYVVARAE
ncbi:MAG: class I poly(R)-hydroxyalkanoic acid synthase [Burkholderiaceae bacterium]|jgi:polyhydroxyalkanoate synthase